MMTGATNPAAQSPSCNLFPQPLSRFTHQGLIKHMRRPRRTLWSSWPTHCISIIQGSPSSSPKPRNNPQHRQSWQCTGFRGRSGAAGPDGGLRPPQAHHGRPGFAAPLLRLRPPPDPRGKAAQSPCTSQQPPGHGGSGDLPFISPGSSCVVSCTWYVAEGGDLMLQMGVVSRPF